jgi:hypothetical protein
MFAAEKLGLSLTSDMELTVFEFKERPVIRAKAGVTLGSMTKSEEGTAEFVAKYPQLARV